MTVRAAILSALAVSSAIAASPEAVKVDFAGGRKSNYKDNTAVDVSAGNGFIVSCTRANDCETAWYVCARRIDLPKSAAAYALSFEIRSDKDWIKANASGENWNSAVNWYGGDRKRIARHCLEVEFRAGGFARFLFSGKIPAGAAQAELQLGTDGPDVLPGETVEVRNASLALLSKDSSIPREEKPDLLAPFVKSLFASPSPSRDFVVRYEIADDSPVDWISLVVTNVLTKAEVRFLREGRVITLETPSGGWTPGRTLLDVYVRDAAGNATVARKAFLTGVKQSPRRVALRDDGTVLLGDKPFFPIGIYAVNPYAFNGNDFGNALAGLKAAGFNMVQSYSGQFDPRLFAAAAELGMVQWTSGRGAGKEKDRWFMDIGREDATVLAWYIGDDTSDSTTPSQLNDLDEATRMLDGTRITCHADCVRGAYAKTNLRDYVNCADVFMPEIYPIDKHHDERCVAETCRDMDRCLADIREAGDGKRPRGVWPILQCFHGKSWNRYPTEREMYAMAFAAVIHGGNGITWFKYGADIGENGSMYSGMFRTPEDWTAMTNISKRIASLASVLLERTPNQPPLPEIVSGPPLDPLGQPSVTLLEKRHRGAVFVLAVNASPEPVRARFKVSDFAGSVCKVVWENRSLPVSCGVFEDAFGPFAVHVYSVPPR